MPRIDNNHPMKTRKKNHEDRNRKYKEHESSSSDENELSFSDTGSENEDMNQHEYRKLVSKIFPSRYMNRKVKASGKLNKLEKEVRRKRREEVSEEDEDVREKKSSKYKSSNHLKKNNKKQSKSKKKGRRKVESESEEILSNSDSENSIYSDEEEYSDEDYLDNDEERRPQGKLNIIFTMGADAFADEDDYTDEEYTDEDYSEEEDEYDSENSDSNYEEEEEYLDSDIEEENEESQASKKRSKKSQKQKEREELNKEEEVLDKFRDMAKDLTSQHKNSKIAKTALKHVKEGEKQLSSKKKKMNKKEKGKNFKKFRKLLREKNFMNDIQFFKDKLSVEEQQKILLEMEDVNKICSIEKPYRITLLESQIPQDFKACAIKKINTLRYMEPGGGEYYKMKNWVDTFMRIPFGKYKNLPVKEKDNIEETHEFMDQAKQTLDKAVFGLNDAKLQIMQMVGQWITNPEAVGSAIAIKGPMGTGKTTLVKEGISKILGRDFTFIALGGATDSSFLEGHSYTYEGSTWGKIVEIIIQSKCMNPVIYFDELDKVSETPKGEEIIGILTHLTDTSQNKEFHDKYFSEINFDLSKCLFIFSYNDEAKVNPILRDRMYRIHTNGYKKKEKIKIANDYLLPTVREQVKFKPEDIIIPDDTIEYLIDTLTENEEGVRNLKRCLEIIYTKLNLYRLMKPNTNLFEKDMSLEVEFPFNVTKDIVDKLIKKSEDDGPPQGMYM